MAGDAEFAYDLRDRARALAAKRRARVLPALAAASNERYTRPGPVAEMLEPNIKDGAGGLRDLHALAWAGWMVGSPGGLEGMVAAGAIGEEDVAALQLANARLLDVRVALHRVTSGRSDLLTLQEQDAVAQLLGMANADALLRSLSRCGPTGGLDQPRSLGAPGVGPAGSPRPGGATGSPVWSRRGGPRGSLGLARATRR